MLDLIEKVGPGGTFINQAESASLCRREAWVPSVLDRNPYNIWSGKGSPSTEELLAAKVTKILDTHQPVSLPDGVQEKFTEILQAAEARQHA